MKVLVVDDDQGLRQSLTLLLEAEGVDVVAEGRPTHALERALGEPFDVVLCDVRMPEIDGLEFLRRYQGGGGNALVIMMSAYGGEDAAIAAMKEGAYDYLPKPFRADEVLLILHKAEEREGLRRRVASLEAELARWQDLDVVADSPAMQHVMEMASRAAPHTTTILITGESGTGKEVVARAIHRMSQRRGERFVAVNCGAIPRDLLESELFGHARGAFTGAAAEKAGLFEEANQGTLLLDEVGDLPLALQVKLLRVLQESELRRVGESRTRKVDVRVLAATARDLQCEVEEGRFREDLFYRLNVIHIHIPPLRKRTEDIDGLVTALLKRATDRLSRQVTITPDALSAIRRRPWRGNVRELENALERAAVLSTDGTIRAEAFPVGRVAASGTHELAAGSPPTLKAAVEAAELRAIEQALEAAGGSRREAARRLGISLRSLFYKIKQHGI